MIRSHLVHMVLYSTLVALFFAVLVRDDPRERRRLLAVLWLAMVGGGLALAYVMYPFPA
jgi:heme/copper-type cytochrome/quinol oxidase subunit 4